MVLAAVTIVLAGLASAASLVTAGAAGAAGSLPCDLYQSGNTPCVAAHSTTRALFGSYNGPLYQVQRKSDGATLNVGVLAAGGYANAAAQDSFCSQVSCRIVKIYDQTANHNDLTVAPDGSAGSGDRGADAAEISVTAGGHKVYGVWVSPGVGYRYTGVAKGVATNGQSEGAYMVASGTHFGSDCCFDYGNAEKTPNDTGNGHMDALTIASTCFFPPCNADGGPWVQADLENGLYMGNGSNPSVTANKSPFVTAVLRNDGQTRFALRGGNTSSGGLSTKYDGSLPTVKPGYKPMVQEGGIILGIGGDNSNRNRGTFFEGAMVRGYPSAATEDAVQANLNSVGYSGETNVPNGPQGPIIGPGGKCVDVAADDTGVNLAPVQLWTCQNYAEDQYWTHRSNGSLATISRCLDIEHNGTTNGAKVELYDCNGVGGQEWRQQSDGSLYNPQSGRCLDSPSGATADGTRLQIWDCNGSAAQKFRLTAG